MSSSAPTKLTPTLDQRLVKAPLTIMACAFLIAAAASLTLIGSVVQNANRIEAARESDRVAAAFAGQASLRQSRLEHLLTTGDLQLAYGSGNPGASVFAEIATRLLDFDGAYLTTHDGRVLDGAEADQPAGQAGYLGLRHFDRSLPAPGLGSDTSNQPATRAGLYYDGYEAIIIVHLDLPKGLPGYGTAAAPARSIVGYRRLATGFLTDLSHRYRIDDIRIVPDRPSDAQSFHPLEGPSGNPSAWLAWHPNRPGDVLAADFRWHLLAVGLLLVGVFLYAAHRLRATARAVLDREARIQRLAGQDELSALPNRRSFDLALDRECARLAREPNTMFAVMLIDLDRFKAVNDTYGHSAGDELIRQIGERLAATIRGGDVIARLGGDEFGVIQTAIRDGKGAAVLGERILAALTEPFDILGIRLSVGCSIGIALAPQDGSSRETLLRQADTALYQSKNRGRNRLTFFEGQMNRELQLKRMVEDDLRRAIAQDELVLHYQPQVSADGRRIVGVEALVRWPHPTQGIISPADFIGIAEERGLIVPLSEWVLRRACTEAQRWPGVRLAVNVSPVQFRHRDFVADVVRVVGETGFDPARLELELTEGVLVDDADAAENAMMDLRGHGIGLALDDFGTGYSSLIYLRRFAFDKIKIDRSFLEYMETTGESAILVHSVVHLGRALGLKVCAEGVETAEQHRFLQAVGCHEMQGFLFSKPVPAAEIDRMLAGEGPFAAAAA